MPAGKKALFTLAVVAAAFLAAAGIAEGLLRVIPVPGVGYNTFYYDELTGGHFYPNTTNIYRNERNDVARRSVNSWGYLDREHAVPRVPGVIRIGFFGDSYTEARQVAFEETFYRRIEKHLNRANTGAEYECISLGFSGNSTLQCYLESGRWTEKLDLDWVVYVFVENDLGDQIREVRRVAKLPYARLAGDSFVVDNTFRERFKHKTRRYHRALQYLRAHSLVASTVETRLRLLKRRGIKLKVTEAERHMAEKSDKRTIPASGVAPSMWPDSLADYARELGSRIMNTWISDVRRSGSKFVVAYIPRLQQMALPYAEQDSWAQWMDSVCRERGVDFVDPSRAFLSELEGGGEVYYDHMTPAGHAAFARTLADYFLQTSRTE
ncbi:MAG: SGNH/GDSL hydrolase family protein [Candidatus Krumholzibacteria bacterium]